MSRIPFVSSLDRLDADGRRVFDAIARSRGEVSRPFQVLLHVPELAERVAELGRVVRSGSHLAEADRELVTLATGRASGCAFVWDSHVEAARRAGVDPAAIEALRAGNASGEGLGTREAALVSFATELCRTGASSEATFRLVHDALGPAATVELAVLVGYYLMLGAVMGTFDAC